MPRVRCSLWFTVIAPLNKEVILQWHIIGFVARRQSNIHATCQSLYIHMCVCVCIYIKCTITRESIELESFRVNFQIPFFFFFFFFLERRKFSPVRPWPASSCQPALATPQHGVYRRRFRESTRWRLPARSLLNLTAANRPNDLFRSLPYIFNLDG